MSASCGTRAAYVRHIKNGEPTCDACKRANADYQTMRDRRIAAGYTTMIPSEKVREHVLALQAQGIGWRTIADRAGVARSVVTRLLRYDTSRPAARLRVATVRKLMAVTAEPAAGSLVNIIPTARRLRALVAIGYTQTDIATRIGMTVANLGALIHVRRETCTVDTANRVAALYQELHAKPGTSQRSRMYAARRNWAVPFAWDDIDNLDEIPKGSAPFTKPRKQTDFEDIAFMLEAGETIPAIAQRLGMRQQTVERAIHRKAVA